MLAHELCDRFYASHGIAPRVVEHDSGSYGGSLGYYGIKLVQLGCQVEQESELGRIKKFGSISAASGTLDLEPRANAGEPVGSMVAEAVKHLRLPPFPPKSHLNCKHKRWGDSYGLVFNLSALLALRWNGRVQIWNHPYHTARLAAELDPQEGKGESSGHFLWIVRGHQEKRMFLAGDGRVLEPKNLGSLWQGYMEGKTVAALLSNVEDALGLRE